MTFESIYNFQFRNEIKNIQSVSTFLKIQYLICMKILKEIATGKYMDLYTRQLLLIITHCNWDCRGRDRMVVGFTTTCLSPLMWVRITIRARYTTLCDKVCR
jgi:hypothetical protein